MPAVRTTRSTSQVSDTGVFQWHGHGRNRWEQSSSSAVGPGPEGGGQQINISTGKRLEETGEAEMWHSADSADSADNGEFFQTRVGEFFAEVSYLHPGRFCGISPVQAKTPDLGRGGRRSCARGRCCHG